MRTLGDTYYILNALSAIKKMESELEERRLLNGLKSLQYLCEHYENIDSGDNFLEVYEDVIQRLEKRMNNSSSLYIQEKLQELPEFSNEEIERYKRDVVEGRGKGQALMYKNAPFTLILHLIMELFRSKGDIFSNVNDKYHVTAEICKNLIIVIEQPALEEMIKQSKK